MDRKEHLEKVRKEAAAATKKEAAPAKAAGPQTTADADTWTNEQ